MNKIEDMAIVTEGLGKFFPFVAQHNLRDFPMWATRYVSRELRRMITPAARRQPRQQPAPPAGIWAVRDVNISIAKGEVIGLIGRNGSGKTTLLKMLSKVTAPSEGSARINGRVAVMLGVGTGFHPMFTGRENIYMSGALLGLTRAEIDRRYEAILDFAEVGEFIDEPVRNYSTGMRSRLGYAVAVEMDSEILLLDEILAVGDAGFQRKCLLRMQESRNQGKTILLVSHNLNAVKGYCNRVLLIEKGRLVREGEPADVVSYYLSNMFALGAKKSLTERVDREGSGVIRIDRYWLEDELGRTVANVVSGEECTICLHFKTSEPIVHGPINASVVITDTSQRWLTRMSTKVTASSFSQASGAGVIRCTIAKLPLIAGAYSFSFRITCADFLADHIEDVGQIQVTAGDFYGTGRQERHSPVLVEHTWSIALRDGIVPQARAEIHD